VKAVTQAEILAWLREQLPRVAPGTAGMIITEHTELVDIDVDSLETLVLFGLAERHYGSALPDSAFPALVTIGDVTSAVLEAIRNRPGSTGCETEPWR
jgi:acyl carrier protein